MRASHACLGTVVTVVLGVLAGTAAAGGAPEPGAEGLFRDPYRSIAVVKDGERHPLFDDATVKVEFRHEGGSDAVSWWVRCNNFVSRLRVGPHRLRLSEIAGTDVGCDDERDRQDRFVTRQFASDPRWARHGRRLRLTSGHDVIRLRRVP